MVEEFHKFLDNEINLKKIEKWIYENTELEDLIGKDNYQFLIEFNYNKKSAELEIQNFIIKNLTSQREFSNWKAIQLLEKNEQYFPNNNLYLFAKLNPKFLKGKKTIFNQFWTKKKIEILWTNNVSEIKRGNEVFLYLGTFENSYVHILVNKKDEIWFENDIGGKQYFGGKKINEAIAKIVIKEYYE